MTPSPEERAREIYQKWEETPLTEYYPRRSKTILIEAFAKALKAYGDERVEECAKVADSIWTYSAAKAIRALKSQP